MVLLVLVMLGALCLLIGHVRGIKGNGNMCALFVIGFILFPVGLLVSLLWTDEEPDRYDCPQCAETIKKKARVCCWCGLDLVRENRK